MDYDFTEGWSGSTGYVFNTVPVSGQSMIPCISQMYVTNSQNLFTCGLRCRRGRYWLGSAHIIALSAVTYATASTQLGLGPDYQASLLRQILQSFNFGAGFFF